MEEKESNIKPKKNGKRRANLSQPARREIGQSYFDRIWLFYYDKAEIKLSDFEKSLVSRWEMAWQMLCGMYPKREIASMIAKKHDISRRQAYEDINNAMSLFGGDPTMANKQAQREIVSQWVMAGIKRSWDEGNLEMHHRYVLRYAKLHGLEDHDDNGLAEIIKKIVPTRIVISDDPETLKDAIAKMRQEISEAHDVEFEEVDDNEAGN